MSDEISSARVGAACAAIAVPVCMALFSRIQILHPITHSGKSFKTLESEYKPWEARGTAVFFLFTAIFSYIFWLCLTFLSEVFIKTGTTEIILRPSGWYWASPALFLAMFASYIPTTLILKVQLGPKGHAEYWEYCDLKAGSNSRKLVKFLAIILIPICTLSILLGFKSYARFNKQDMIFNTYFNLSEVSYSYADLKKIRYHTHFKAPNGNIREAKHYTLAFNDGFTYNFKESVANPNIYTQREIVEYLQNKTDLSIIRTKKPR
jgi:hypothetical protein